jgi:hypothetical protein
MEKPNCYKCAHRREIHGDSRCDNTAAHVTGHAHGARKGWFFWPFNFDPVWLLTCDGFEEKQNENKKT